MRHRPREQQHRRDREGADRAVPLWSEHRYFFFMKNMNSLLAVSAASNSLPVCLENAWKSFTAPGSVAITRNTCPETMSFSDFLVRKMGSGQFNPRASS